MNPPAGIVAAESSTSLNHGTGLGLYGSYSTAKAVGAKSNSLVSIVTKNRLVVAPTINHTDNHHRLAQHSEGDHDSTLEADCAKTWPDPAAAM